MQLKRRSSNSAIGSGSAAAMLEVIAPVKPNSRRFRMVCRVGGWWESGKEKDYGFMKATVCNVPDGWLSVRRMDDACEFQGLLAADVAPQANAKTTLVQQRCSILYTCSVKV